MPKVTFLSADGSRLAAEARVGESILALAWRVGAGIEGDCEGAMACSTCHVILAPDDFDRLPERVLRRRPGLPGSTTSRET